MPDLVAELMECGLLQFGLFEGVPFKISLDLLGSYPALMTHLAQTTISAQDITQYERLLCTSDAVPLGTAICLQSDIPMIYSRGTDKDGASDLVGAYDVGHPTLLITNVWSGFSPIKALVQKAERVGLDVRAVFAVVSTTHQPANELEVFTLLHLSDALETMPSDSFIPPGQIETVKRWLTRQ